MNDKTYTHIIAASPRKAENGNILFLILIAVALFAALSYVIANSTRSGGGSIGKENDTLAASSYLQYATEVQRAVERLRIIGKVSEWGMDFWNPREPASANGNCPDERCQVFSPGGGGAVWRSFNGTSMIGQSFFSSAVKNVGSTAPDLILFLGYVPTTVCQIINYRMGVSPSLDSPVPADSHAGSSPYLGTLSDFPSSSKIWGNVTNPQFSGKHDFCYSHSAWNNVFIHVLMVR